MLFYPRTKLIESAADARTSLPQSRHVNGMALTVREKVRWFTNFRLPAPGMAVEDLRHGAPQSGRSSHHPSPQENPP